MSLFLFPNTRPAFISAISARTDMAVGIPSPGQKNTIRNYEFVLGNFQEHFVDAELSSIKSEDVLDFMTKLTDGNKQSTKKSRFALLSAFFNFVKKSNTVRHTICFAAMRILRELS